MIYKTAQYISRKGRKEATTQRIHRTIYFFTLVLIGLFYQNSESEQIFAGILLGCFIWQYISSGKKTNTTIRKSCPDKQI